MTSIAELKPDTRNARRHTPRNVATIESSLQRDGFGRSILLANDGTIIAGNATIDAAAQAGIEDVLIVESDGTRVIVVKRTDVEPGSERFHMLAVSDNWAAELAEWDEAVLAELNDELDLSALFNDDELAKILGNVTQEGLTDPDDVPVVVDPITKPGDLWLLGRHRLLCGDSTVATDVERLMGGEKAEMVFTDPPYGMDLDTDYSSITGSKKAMNPGVKGKSYAKVIGDSEDFDPTLVLSTFAAVDEVFLWGADYYATSLPRGGWFVWDKCVTADGVVSDGAEKMIGSAFELCWSKQRHKRLIARLFHRGYTSVDSSERVHPTQKPIQLAAWFIERFSASEAIIVDPFLGSGTTMIAAEQLNRTCYGMEIDPHYCDVIVTRWQDFTGQTATLEQTPLETAAD